MTQIAVRERRRFSRPAVLGRVYCAGAIVEGYSAREDYISSLASRGSPVAASCILGAALATSAVAAFRASCPSGPARCGLTDTAGGDWVAPYTG